MQFSTAISLLKGRLSNYQSTVIEPTLKTEMNARQFMLEQEDFKPWFLLSESATTQTTALEERMEVPDDFIMEWEKGALEWKLTTESIWKPLEKDDYDYLRKVYTDVSGSPSGYDLAGKYFLLVPAPNVVYDLKMRYYAHQPENVNDTDENAWLKYAAEWLIAETGIVVANNYLSNDRAAQGFNAMRVEAKARIERLNTAREEANNERIMGDGV